jgi:hypothetical protein
LSNNGQLERDGADPMLARFAMMRALNADREVVLEMSAPRRKRAKRYEIVW